METSRQQPSEHPPPQAPPSLPYPAAHPHHLSGRSSPFLHHLPHQMGAQQQQQQQSQNGVPLPGYAGAPNGHPPHIRTHSANAAFTLGAGMATSPITPTVSSERGRGEDWSAPEPERGGDSGVENGTGPADGADDSSQQAAAGAPAQPGVANGADIDAAASANGGSLQVTPAWNGIPSAQASRQSSVGADAQAQPQSTMTSQAQYYAQHPSQFQYMYYGAPMSGSYGHQLASQPVYSSQGYAQQQQAYAIEAARVVQAQQHAAAAAASQQQQQQAVPGSAPGSHPGSPNALAAAAALQHQQQQGAVPAPPGAPGYYMPPYPYGGGQAGQQQQAMYHYVPGYPPSTYAQALYRPPYPSSGLASAHSQPLSMAEALQNLPDEVGTSSQHHAPSVTGGSEYSSILGAGEHEDGGEPEAKPPPPPPPAPARQSASSRKGKRKAAAVEDAVHEPIPPPPEKQKAAPEPKAAKKRPKRKRPPGSQAGKEKKHECSHCGRSFARAYNLKTHEETHLLDPPKPYVCEHDSCNHKSFSRSHDLIRHRGSVHNEGPAAGKPPQKKTRPPKKKRAGPAGGLHHGDASVQGSSLDHGEHDDGHHMGHDESMTSQQLLDEDEEHHLDHDGPLDHHQYEDDGDMGHEVDGHENGALEHIPEYDPSLIEPTLFHATAADDPSAVGGQVDAPTVNPMDFTQAVHPSAGGQHSSATPSALLKQAHDAGSEAYYATEGEQQQYGAHDDAAAAAAVAAVLDEAHAHDDRQAALNGAGGAVDEEEGEVEHALDGLDQGQVEGQAGAGKVQQQAV